MKAVLFDFGGTIDTGGVHWSEKFWELYQHQDIDIPKPLYEKAFAEADRLVLDDPGIARATLLETLRKQLLLQFRILGIEGRDHDLPRMADACYGDVRKTIFKAKSLLGALKPKYKLGVVSNFYGNLDVVCTEFGLDTLFEATVDSVVVGVKKPDPAIFRLALERLDVRASETFVVGDSYERDIVPSKSLGCRTIWLNGKSWTQPQSTASADYTIHSFEEIKKIL